MIFKDAMVTKYPAAPGIKPGGAEKRKHAHVLTVAESNLDLVINQIESMGHARYDELLDMLDHIKEAFKQVKL